MKIFLPAILSLNGVETKFLVCIWRNEILFKPEAGFFQEFNRRKISRKNDCEDFLHSKLIQSKANNFLYNFVGISFARVTRQKRKTYVCMIEIVSLKEPAH